MKKETYRKNVLKDKIELIKNMDKKMRKEYDHFLKEFQEELKNLEKDL